jgi:hypothetical protein
MQKEQFPVGDIFSADRTDIIIGNPGYIEFSLVLDLNHNRGGIFHLSHQFGGQGGCISGYDFAPDRTAIFFAIL